MYTLSLHHLRFINNHVDEICETFEDLPAVSVIDTVALVNDPGTDHFTELNDRYCVYVYVNKDSGYKWRLVCYNIHIYSEDNMYKVVDAINAHRRNHGDKK